MIALALAALLFAAPASADVTQNGGWVKRGSSLLLYDAAGELVSEIGLTSSEEGAGGKLTAHEVRGAAAKSGRFAWTLERTRTWNASRAKLLDSKRLLKLLGSRGEEIWTSAEADAGEKLEPVVFSDDGEVLLLLSRGKDGWRAAAKGYLGNTLLELYPAPELEDARLTRDGRYALIRWTVPDQQSTHTFWNIPARQRKDLPSSELYLGQAALAEDGKVTSHGKLVVDLATLAPATTTQAPAAAAPAVPAAVPEPKK